MLKETLYYINTNINLNFSEFHWITRKGSMRQLTNIHCEDIKKDRLGKYRQALEEEQPGFLEEKIQMLEFIREEEQACNTAVTVTQEEIDEVKRQLEDLLKEREEKHKLVEEQTELSIK